MKWWKEGIIYQIYPRSFFDSSGNGIGDLNGISKKLHYIKSLGVDMVWICPFYKSPNKDNGYDISDYKDISKIFGDLNSFDTLLKKMHGKEIPDSVRGEQRLTGMTAGQASFPLVSSIFSIKDK